MTAKKHFTPEQVVRARSALLTLSLDDLLSKGYINIQAVLGDVVEYQVVLTDAGDKKIATIKKIRGLTYLSLAEAKVIADNGGVVITYPSKPEADFAVKELRDQGASAVVNRVVR